MLSRLLFVIFSLALAGRASAGGAPGHIFRDVTVTAPPYGIAAGPDGALWFTDSSNRIGRTTFDGELIETPQYFPIVPEASLPFFITPGPDGNLWFTQDEADAIGRITPAGVADSFPLPTASVRGNIVTGPDGNLWFPALSESRGVEQGLLGRITTSGTLSLFPLEFQPLSVTNGPDGALWVTSLGRVGRVTTSGADDFFDVEQAFLAGITTGPDGALWFTGACFSPGGAAFGLESACEYGIGRLTVDGALTKFPQVDPYSVPIRIIRGPEDNLWFIRDKTISRMNLAGRVTDIVNLDDQTPNDIAVGPDGGIWFTLGVSPRIARVNTLVFDYTELQNSEPMGMAPGPDGTVWFTDCAGNRVGRIGRGSLIQHEVGADRCPTAIAATPDGGAWFVNFNSSTIGRVNADGEVDELSLPPPDDLPNDIVYGPDGNFWVTLDLGSIARITPEGVIDVFPTATEESGPQGITVGPDGNLWFAERLINRIGRMTPDGDAVDFPIPFNNEPHDITTASDGAMYFTQIARGRVGRVTTDGEITQLDARFVGFEGNEIALGPDGALWFTMVPAGPIFDGAQGRPCTRSAGDGGALPCPPGKLGRIAADGRVTSFDLPNGERDPAGLAGTEDGLLFVAMANSAEIASIELVAAEPTPTITNTPEETSTPTRTQTGAATATRTPTATRTSTTEPGVATATPTDPGNEPTATETPLDNTPLPTETQTFLTCAGDCNGDNAVSIAELVTAVNIALDQRSVDACFSADTDNDGVVRVNELVAAVTRALRGC